MIETTAIKTKNTEPMMVTWEMLRRCNLDCTYCASTRHDLVSEMPPITELKETFDFIRTYTDLYNNNRINSNTTNITFTGGEPTINPAFWELLDYIKSFNGFRLSLTTNGTWGPQFREKVKSNFSHVTISYHTEADSKLKQRTIDNILDLHNNGISVQANVMLHCDNFDEARDLCEYLRKEGVKVRAAPIGDGTVELKGWFIDSDGTNRRTSHEYTIEQQEWFYKFMGVTKEIVNPTEGTSMGRSCCGGRCLLGKVNNEWQEVKLVKNNFKDWYCMINWYFLHIDQHTKNVLHHQTCRATHHGIDYIGSLNDTEKILNNVRELLSGDNIKPIICPNQRCGCGMCVHKARDLSDFESVWKETTFKGLNIS